ncbi:MAG TPA: thioredoxin family protein [Polyangiales bacterium]|nr:thioredoxin family protein [Polyangiales bacterium]
MKLRCTLVALALVACDAKREPAPRPVAAPLATKLHHGLAWYEDELEQARVSAARTNKLLFVDLWAGWCHTCLSMREYVLTRETLAESSHRLVFVALDTEKATNAEALRSLPIGAWPTFYLLDGNGRIYGRWVGAGSPAQMERFARDGLRAFDADKALPPNDPLTRLVAGDRAVAQNQLAAARMAYEGALARSSTEWPRRADAWASLLGVLRKLGDSAACADAGLRGLEETGSSSSATDFSYWALDCARALTKTDPRVGVLRRRISSRLLTLCELGDEALSPDDRGDACGLMHTVSEDLGDAATARRAYELRLNVLTAAAAGKPDEIAKTYDFARAETLVGLGRGEQALKLLEARERALPDDYNPPHQLARTYRELGKWDEGLAAIDRALKLAVHDAPRRAAMLGVRAELLAGVGREPEVRAALEEQLAAYRALPEGQRQPQREQSVAAKLANL